MVFKTISLGNLGINGQLFILQVLYKNLYETYNKSYMRTAILFILLVIFLYSFIF